MSQRYQYSEDLFADTRMTFGEHLEELRTCMWRALGGFMIALVLSFFVGKQALEFISKPVEDELGRFYERRKDQVIEKLRKGDLDQPNRPTPFIQVGVYVPPLEAALQGKPADPRRPVSQEEYDRLSDEEKQNAIVVQEGDIKLIWLRHQTPVLEAAYLQEADRIVGRRPALSTLSIQESFMVYVKVCMVVALVLSSPWVFYQIWSFIAAGLYPHERRYVHVFLPFSILLFTGGVTFCQLVVMPKAINALLWFNEWLGMEPDLRLNDWLSFALLVPVVFGLAFQTPLVMLFLERVGLATIDGFRAQRRLAWFCLAAVSAIITPSPDPQTMLLLWFPMCLLYEFGIILCRMQPPHPPSDLDVPETKEMVEV
jgi:sec-independent protein translocase protein TatC